MWTYGATAAMPVRMGFGVDVVDYSGRSAMGRADAQVRTLSFVNGIAAAANVDTDAMDQQPAGDGMIAFFPPDADLRRCLTALTRTAAEWLAEDNRRYVDRLRLRMSIVIGPVSPAALGSSTNTVVECARLLDSDVLRGAMTEHPASDLAVLASEGVHSFIIAQDFPGIDAAQFSRVEASAKKFQSQAWLWVAPVAGGAIRQPLRHSGADLATDLARLQVVTTVDHERLFGVDDELEQLAAYLSNRSGDWVVAIWGPPGVGKTALAYELILRHAQPVGFHRVAAVSAKFGRLETGGRVGLEASRLAIDWRDLLVDVARQLKLPIDLVPSAVEAQLPGAMPDDPCLILIDNLETVPQAQVAVDFLTEKALAPHKVILTTRASVATATSRFVRQRHWTGPDRAASLEYATYLASDDPTLDPRPVDLSDVVDAAERTPLLIRLIIRQAIFQRLPIREVISRLRQRTGSLGSAVWQYLYADSLDALAQHVGEDTTAQLMSVFCAKISGSSFDRDSLHELSEIDSWELFDRAIAAACGLTLIRSFDGNTQFTVHSLLREFFCSDVEQPE